MVKLSDAARESQQTMQYELSEKGSQYSGHHSALPQQTMSMGQRTPSTSSPELSQVNVHPRPAPELPRLETSPLSNYLHKLVSNASSSPSSEVKKKGSMATSIGTAPVVGKPPEKNFS